MAVLSVLYILLQYIKNIGVYNRIRKFCESLWALICQAKLRELDEKYKKAMMMNAQLDNEKHSLVYKVELMKDQVEEMEESFTQLQREYKDKCRVRIPCNDPKNPIQTLQWGLRTSVGKNIL